MDALRLVLRMLGWLLTPLVAWAASFVGAIVGATVASWRAGAVGGLWLTIGMGLAFALVGTHLWLRLVRRSPALREALHLEPDGTPLPPDPVVEAPAVVPPGEDSP